MLLDLLLEQRPSPEVREAVVLDLRRTRDRLSRLDLLVDVASWLLGLAASAAFLHWLPALFDINPGTLLVASLMWLAAVLTGRRWLIQLLPVRRRYRFHSALLDERPPILYLRSFQQDLVNNSTLTHGYESTFEERLVRVLRDIGPVVAVGHPYESVPPDGAARLYLDPDRWQGEVRRLMSMARFVVVNPADTEGVLWEVDFAMRNMEPERLLVFFSFPWDRKDSHYRRFRDAITSRTENILHSPLPRVIPDDTLFLYFEPDWTARIVRHWEFIFSRSELFPRIPSAASFRRALHPVFQRAGQDARIGKAQALRLAAVAAVVAYPFLFALLLSRVHPELPGLEPPTLVRDLSHPLIGALCLYLGLFITSRVIRHDRWVAKLVPQVEVRDLLRAFSMVTAKWRTAMVSLYTRYGVDPSYAGPVGGFTADSVSSEWREMAARYARDPAVRAFLAELDHLAATILTEEHAGKPKVHDVLAENYCLLVRRCYGLISAPRADAASPVHSNIVHLYTMWNGVALPRDR